MGIEDSYVYQKEVDWSLLTEGLTLPIKEQVVFGQRTIHQQPCITIIPSTRACSIGKARARRLKIPQLDRGISITGNAAVRCSYSSGSSNRIGLQMVPRRIPIWAKPAM